jgi:hypothetical protein
MFSIVKIAIFTLFVGSYCAQPQYVGTVQDFKAKGWGKAENDLIISWQLESRDVTTSQVSVSDRQGHEITSLKILGLVPDASFAHVHDVSARPGESSLSRRFTLVKKALAKFALPRHYCCSTSKGVSCRSWPWLPGEISTVSKSMNSQTSGRSCRTPQRLRVLLCLWSIRARVLSPKNSCQGACFLFMLMKYKATVPSVLFTWVMTRMVSGLAPRLD